MSANDPFPLRICVAEESRSPNIPLNFSDETTDKTTQFWLMAKARAIIDSHSTKQLEYGYHAARAFLGNEGALLLFLNESGWLSAFSAPPRDILHLELH